MSQPAPTRKVKLSDADRQFVADAQAVAASPAGRRVLARIIFVHGRALAFGRHDAYEAGRRDFARQVFRLFQSWAPEHAPAIQAEAPVVTLEFDTEESRA